MSLLSYLTSLIIWAFFNILFHFILFHYLTSRIIYWNGQYYYAIKFYKFKFENVNFKRTITNCWKYKWLDLTGSLILKVRNSFIMNILLLWDVHRLSLLHFHSLSCIFYCCSFKLMAKTISFLNRTFLLCKNLNRWVFIVHLCFWVGYQWFVKL